MEVLRTNKLYLRAEKCEFERTRIEYLGVIISHNHVEMDPTKVAGVAEWPTPKNRKEVQSFLGFTNFYRRFIPHFSDDARPLFDLSKKDVAFRWGIPEDEAFNKLKKSITSTPILTLPSDDQPFCKGTTRFPCTTTLLPIISYHFLFLCDHFQPPAMSFHLARSSEDHRDHRRSSQEAAQPRTASPGFVIAAFQIWEAWYYTWSLVYTHSALTKVP